MKKPDQKPASLCLVPWVHTYLSPQVERRLCCASREEATSFKQYIDDGSADGEFNPQTLEEHWNSERVRRVRRQMMAGEEPPECEVCNTKILNTDVYRDYFWHLFKHKYDDIWATTNEDGYTTMEPVSWDYRFSNLCNFKCRMCGDMLSSSWETEQKIHKMVDLTQPKNRWMQPAIREQITAFQDTQAEAEFANAVDEHRIEEVYWVGGEPLMYEQHWRYMKQIIDRGDGPTCYARYNTNLSRVTYKGVDLYTNILAHLRDWQICASIDGTGPVGEYIRTGLVWDDWLANYKRGLEIQTNHRQMRIDFTLTTPGLFEVKNIVALAEETNTQILAKVTFAFDPSITMCPLTVPRSVLEPMVKDLLAWMEDGHLDWRTRSLYDVLSFLIQRPTFQEQWPDTYKEGWAKGKKRILQLEEIRPNPLTFEGIISHNADMLAWWQSINV